MSLYSLYSPVLLKDTERSSISCIANNEDAGSGRQTLCNILVKGDISKLHGPCGRAFNVTSFNVAITGSSSGCLVDAWW